MGRFEAEVNFIEMANGIEDLRSAGRLTAVTFCVGICAVAATALKEGEIEEALTVLTRLPEDAMERLGSIAADDSEAGPVLIALAERLVEAGVVTEIDDVDVGLTGAVSWKKEMPS